MQAKSILFTVVLAACAAVPATAQQLFPDQRLEAVFEATTASDYVGAITLAQQTGDPGVIDLVLWHRLRDGQGEWWEYRDFLARHPDWPGLARLRREGERRIPADARPGDIIAYFGADAPQTGIGALRLANAFRAVGREGEARETVIAAWRGLSLSPSTQGEFLADWGTVLAGQHEARLDHLLWEGRSSEAERMFPLVDAGWRALAEARIALRQRRNGVDALIDAVPARLASDPGLAYERFVWRDRAGLDASALELLLQRTGSAESLGRPEEWGQRRRSFARSAFRAGDIRTAYRLASQHHSTEGYPRADMEWFAGWLALRHMGDPGRAAGHFEAFLAMVETPISVARGAYWLGRAEEARGRRDLAREMFALAARHQTTFYGQLAAQRAGIPVDTSIIGNRSGPTWRNAAFTRDPRLAMADIATRGGDWITAELFLTRLALDARDPAEIELIAQYAIDRYGRADTAVRLSKDAALDGRVFADTAYPVTELATLQAIVAPEFVKAIARQESELNPEAESHAGALGLMQVMPATARSVAGEIGLPYSRDRLTQDWQYNAQIGTAYLAGLLDEFDGAVILAAAGYNAGPGRPRSWMERFGDPRRMSPDDAVDWIESIPFNETRNYVMRVVEAIHIYRLRLGGQAVPWQIEEDITSGRLQGF
ncbi:MAG: lytic transglycosylase domain-containing protein [Rubricella sp.]